MTYSNDWCGELTCKHRAQPMMSLSTNAYSDKLANGFVAVKISCSSMPEAQECLFWHAGIVADCNGFPCEETCALVVILSFLRVQWGRTRSDMCLGTWPFRKAP